MSPLSTSPTVLAASTVTTIGAVIVVLLVLGLSSTCWSTCARAAAEVGSEIELAPNRKPYYDDEELETTVLNRTLRWALVLLIVIAVGLPLYWLNEPSPAVGRHRGLPVDVRRPRRRAVRRGLAVPELPRPRGHRRPGAVHDHRRRGRSSSPRSTGGRRRSTRCCCGSPVKRSSTSSTTAGRSRRCPAGARRSTRARSTSSRSPTWSTTSSRSSSARRGASARSRTALAEELGPRRARAPTDDEIDAAIERHRLRRPGGRRGAVQPRDRPRRRLRLRPLPHPGLVDHPPRARTPSARPTPHPGRLRRLPRRQRRLRPQPDRRAHPPRSSPPTRSWSPSSPPAASTASRTATTASAAAACPASATTPTPKRSRATG